MHNSTRGYFNPHSKTLCLIIITLFNKKKEKEDRKIKDKNSKKNVNVSAKIHDFEYLIEHALACTLERNDEDVPSISELKCGTVHEVFNMEH